MAALPDPRTTPFLTVTQAAQILEVNPRTIYSAVDRGECPAVRVGKVIRIPTVRFLEHYGLSAQPAAYVA
jgi:excisionase family DNA binding protein